MNFWFWLMNQELVLTCDVIVWLVPTLQLNWYGLYTKLKCSLEQRNKINLDWCIPLWKFISFIWGISSIFRNPEIQTYKLSVHLERKKLIYQLFCLSSNASFSVFLGRKQINNNITVLVTRFWFSVCRE